MASSKSKEDELSASISKSMTIDKLKEDLKNANISISGVKKKSDYVDLYISNGLHKRAATSLSATEIPEEKKAPKSPETSPKSVSKSSKSVSKAIKEELIMSLMTKLRKI